MKGTKRERQEIHSIQVEIIKKGLYYCIVEVRKNQDIKQIIHHKR